MRIFRSLAAYLIAALLLAGCATLGTPTPQQQAQADRAEALYRRGEFDQAAQAFLALAAQSHAGRDHYRLRAAEAFGEEGTLDRAAQALDGVKRRHLEGEEASRYDLLDAQLALSRNDAARALGLLAGATPTLPPALRSRAQELSARAQAQAGDAWGAAATRTAMDAQLGGLDRSGNEQQIVALLGKLPSAELLRRRDTLPATDPLRVWVEQALARQGVAVAVAQPQLEHPVGTVLPAEGAAAGTREGYRALRAVALLLPADGQLAAAAGAVRDGFFAAYFDAARGGAPRPTLKLYDSGNDPAQAVAAYQKAVADGAELVIGPLSREAVAAVFQQATLPVPVLALNHPDGTALPPPGSAEFGLLPENEGAQVAEYMAARGLKNALVFAAEDDWAQRAARAFKAQFEGTGGRVAGEAALKSDAVNYAGQIAGMPLADADGVFLALRPQQARLLLPQLKLAKATQPVFATSHVYSGDDAPNLDRDLDGVEFCDAPWLFDAQPGLPRRDDIAAQLPLARGAGARLFAFGMDAFALTPYLDWLRMHAGSYLPGATGQLAEDSFGRVHRTLTWARFADGVARPLAGGLDVGAPTATAAPAPVPAPAGAAPSSP
ncbi:MAG: penicillin-binding protein activator [Mizugakiibacter sp.]|uniref:penicillin-binding protein activator n=1 Tax=Mizugakiibacter sp. TaxID=1972610 RepID=UPI0031C0562D|nr:penicillin-binding protein activator [Xanthomonadaceae bacterium]